MGCELLGEALKRSRYPLKIVSTAITQQEVLDGLRVHTPAVVLMATDLSDAPLSGLNVLRQIRENGMPTRVVVLLDDHDSEIMIDAFRAGARGIFCRAESVEQLAKCLYTVGSGQIWVGSEQLEFLLDAFAQAAPLRLADAKGKLLLTKREEQVVALVAEGLSNREISQRLNLSEHTVKNYMFKIFDKLGVSSRVEVLLYALAQDDRNRQKNAA